jgi:hypothetical protein
MISSAPMNAMSELTRQNLEVWTRMQETMLAAFSPPREPTSAKENDDGKKP